MLRHLMLQLSQRWPQDGFANRRFVHGDHYGIAGAAGWQDAFSHNSDAAGSHHRHAPRRGKDVFRPYHPVRVR